MSRYEGLWNHLGEVETTKEYQGYIYSIGKALAIVVLGSMCGLRSVSEIHQWATKKHVESFLWEHFGIEKTPCYYWLLCLLKLVDPESLNHCFIRWVQSMLPEDGPQLTLAFDGKTICSADAMQGYESPLHIISAHVAELGLTLGQKTVSGKSNEIPALRDLLDLLEVEGCMVVADAMHCQKRTALAIVERKADYLLSAKDNQLNLKAGIEEYVQDEALRKTMDSSTTVEKNGGRVEKRSAYVTCDVDWLEDRVHWPGLACIGAIHRQCEGKANSSSEWHYYISSRPLTAVALLRFARKEWSIESMHWLLDVHFREDFCRVEDELVQQNLNMVRKIVLNTIRQFKAASNSKRAFSKIMLDCLLEPRMILAVLQT
jgi:predicted transposase YbfD/YdcC